MNFLFLRRLLTICVLVVVPSISHAGTYNVPSATCPTIQSGVDAAHDGDTVLVADGTYSGPGNRDIDFHGKSLTVTSQNGPAKTIIDCGGYASTDGSGNHRGFYIHSGEKSAAISGITVKNGYEKYVLSIQDSGDGGGIFHDNGSGTITLTNCTVSGSSATDGGGIYNLTYRGTTILTNCTILRNSATDGSGGIFNENIYGGTTTLTNCTVSGNSATNGGGIYNFSYIAGAITLTNCGVSGNLATNGGGIYNLTYGGTTILTNCTVSGNSATNGGGIYSSNYSSTSTLTNDIIYADSGGEVVDDSNSNSIPTITYSNVQGGSLGTGNIDKDPLFVSVPNGDLHLKPGSPCLGAGTPDGAPPTDLDGNPRPNPPSMGAYELAPSIFHVDQAKLGVPFVSRDGKGGYTVQLSLYLKGSGKGTFSGRWLLDNTVLYTENQLRDFVEGTWQPGPTIVLPYEQFKGNHKLIFQVDAPTTLTTGSISSYVTGFDPAVNGWRFQNYPDNSPSGYLSGGADGLCVGFSVSAWDYYMSHTPTPRDFPNPTRSSRIAIKSAHFLGISHIAFVDDTRLLIYKNGSNELATESASIVHHLQDGNPWVVGLCAERFGATRGSPGHGVVACSDFDVIDAYVDQGDQTKSVRRMLTYDPNYPNTFTALDVYNDAGTYSFSYYIASAPPITMHYLYAY